ncbi:MAG: nucleotidyl transferase AbiEii/AbiGii toxin family protein [Melioribacteraceae bacterium]|nr:nucleotidyl transferase AbiEii/AbiGii toxin family protein [Melioribacteraceae bacterium]MCF8263102.1 nucleotidyl transferase AbiEii/AbiGii toxin family protein [Melioribacteraceae bacterium]MCF8430566.1 nucleotidyl transferase AbiEii/AbiGii toxin family protein [Melioribacteraceae bacterium]
MIDKESLDIEWINKVSAIKRNADRILVEKVIRALLLLEGLAKINLEFIFKGGTALMLLLNSSRRLSIDIDIIIQNEPKELETLFQKLVGEQFFNRVELHLRVTESKIKKAHYKFYYTPIHKTRAEEEYILLDILFEKATYQNITNIPIVSDFVISKEENISVPIPSVEDILGDKLTAFAPNTTGIPYFKNETSMSMEIMKQLYDISNLFDNISDLEIVANTFKSFSETELSYRGKGDLNYNHVVNDIIETALCITSRGNAGNGNFDELRSGINRVSGFIFSEAFHLDKAITAASKAAYASTAIKYKQKNVEKYSDPLQMEEWIIENPLWVRMNRLKKSNPEAYFYWYKMHKLIKDNNE